MSLSPSPSPEAPGSGRLVPIPFLNAEGSPILKLVAGEALELAPAEAPIWESVGDVVGLSIQLMPRPGDDEATPPALEEVEILTDAGLWVSLAEICEPEPEQSTFAMFPWKGVDPAQLPALRGGRDCIVTACLVAELPSDVSSFYERWGTPDASPIPLPPLADPLKDEDHLICASLRGDHTEKLRPLAEAAGVSVAHYAWRLLEQTIEAL